MKLLALDTSSLACSVAIEIDGAITERHEERPREHTRILLPMIRSVIADTEIELKDLDAIVLGNGPGSFIGMRIAASVSQGLAYGAGIGIVPVSSMAAVATQVFAQHDADEVVVTQDAHMHEVYLGIYRRGHNGLPVAQFPERLCGQERIAELETRADGVRLAAGFGWQRYPHLLAANSKRITGVIAILHPRARYMLGLGAHGLKGFGSVAPTAVSPAYLRQKVAEKPAPGP